MCCLNRLWRLNPLFLTMPADYRYWDFMSSSRWNRQWKQHGQSGPSPFAATPSHRDQWHAQLGRLKQKAAFRKAKQKAQQEAQTAEHEPSQHRTTDNAAHQSHTADGVHFQGEQQSSMQDRESSQGHSAAANNVSSMNIRQSEAQHQAVHDAEFHQQSDPQSSPSWPTVSGQHSGNVDHNHAKGEILTAPSGDDHEGTQPVTAGHGSTQHHNTGKQDGGEAAVVHTMPIAHVQVHENADPVPLTVMPHMGAMVSHSADGSSACPVENIGPASYSHVVEEVSMTPSERVQSQLIGLRRRAARKA